MLIKSKKYFTDKIRREIKFDIFPVKIHDNFLFESEENSAKFDKIWLEKYVKYIELDKNEVIDGIQTYKLPSFSYKRKVLRYSDVILNELKNDY